VFWSQRQFTRGGPLGLDNERASASPLNASESAKAQKVSWCKADFLADRIAAS
jgi:hypothetical protein